MTSTGSCKEVITCMARTSRPSVPSTSPCLSCSGTMTRVVREDRWDGHWSSPVSMRVMIFGGLRCDGERRTDSDARLRLLSTLGPAAVFTLLGKPLEQTEDPQAVLAAYGQLYDERGGAVEIGIKESKQGIGITKRNKKRFAAQAMVMLLGQLAHNMVVWFKRWLMNAAETPQLNRLGVPRLVRDVFTMSGKIEVDEAKTITRITINKCAPLGRHCLRALQTLLKPEHVRVILGET